MTTKPTCEICGQPVELYDAAGFRIDAGTYYHIDCEDAGAARAE